jgi:hypothetical protein
MAGDTLNRGIDELIRRGDLDLGAPAYGTAMKAIQLGYERLTRSEKKLYGKVVIPALERL